MLRRIKTVHVHIRRSPPSSCKLVIYKLYKCSAAPSARVSFLRVPAGFAAPPSRLRRQKRRRDGEGAHGAAREALRPRHHPRIQEVEVQPVRDHVAGADRGGEHEGGGGVVQREEDGLHLQGQDEEQRHALPLHLGQGHPPPRQLRRRPRQVQVQPAAGIHGTQGQGFHVPEQHLKRRLVIWTLEALAKAVKEPRYLVWRAGDAAVQRGLWIVLGGVWARGCKEAVAP